MRGDDHPLDLVSALVDGGDLGVAVGPFHLHALEAVSYTHLAYGLPTMHLCRRTA